MNCAIDTLLPPLPYCSFCLIIGNTILMYLSYTFSILSRLLSLYIFPTFSNLFFFFHFCLHLSLSLISLFFILLYILYPTYILGITINFSIPSEDALLLLYKIIIGISAIVSLSCLLCALLYVLKWYIRGQSERSTGSYSTLDFL